LICGMWRFWSERESIVFVIVVLFLVGLIGNGLLGLLLWWHRELFFGWNHGGCQCWGSENRMGPRTHESRTRVTNESTQFTKSRETKNLWKPELASKVVNPFTRTLAPPFIGRRRDFYIPRLPSNLRNIPSVNTYKNVFYIPWFAGLISYIYKPATSSHFKPGLLKRHLWLGFFWPPKLLFMKIIAHCDFRIETPPDSRTSQIPNSLNFAGFQSSWNGQQICEQNPSSAIIFTYYKKVSKMHEIH
jgi:hypothetical protein